MDMGDSYYYDSPLVRDNFGFNRLYYIIIIHAAHVESDSSSLFLFISVVFVCLNDENICSTIKTHLFLEFRKYGPLKCLCKIFSFK